MVLLIMLKNTNEKEEHELRNIILQRDSSNVGILEINYLILIILAIVNVLFNGWLKQQISLLYCIKNIHMLEQHAAWENMTNVFLIFPSIQLFLWTAADFGINM